MSSPVVSCITFAGYVNNCHSWTTAVSLHSLSNTVDFIFITVHWLQYFNLGKLSQQYVVLVL